MINLIDVAIAAENHPLREHVTIAATAFLSGGGLVRLGNTFSKSMAPLPPNSGFWSTTLYNFVKGVTGHDPTYNEPAPAPAAVPIKP